MDSIIHFAPPLLIHVLPRGDNGPSFEAQTRMSSGSRRSRNFYFLAISRVFCLVTDIIVKEACRLIVCEHAVLAAVDGER